MATQTLAGAAGGAAARLSRCTRAPPIQLEDQAFPKRCGRLDGKSLIGSGEMCGKRRAALDARRSADILILARTDALAIEGLDATLERAEAYLACSSMRLLVEALRTPEQMDAACLRFAARPSGEAPAGASGPSRPPMQRPFTRCAERGAPGAVKDGGLPERRSPHEAGLQVLLVAGARFELATFGL